MSLTYDKTGFVTKLLHDPRWTHSEIVESGIVDNGAL